MKLNATSYFAGIGTVVAALAVGFGGALMIIGSDHTTGSRNRVQQVMARAPVSTPAAPVKSAEPVELVTSLLAPVSVSEPAPIAPPPAQSDPVPPVVTKHADGPTPLRQPVLGATQDADKSLRAQLRVAEVKRAVELENQRKRIERKRKQQEIEAAANAVRRMLHDNGNGQIVLTGNVLTARGFFGNE